MRKDDGLLRFTQLVADAYTMMGWDMHKCGNLRAILTQAGFTNIQLVKKKVPIGSWDKKQKIVGKYQKIAMLEVIPALVGKPLEMLGMGRAEREVWAATARKAIEDRSVHRYFNYYFWTAQKPKS
jgi:hypothetical protein